MLDSVSIVWELVVSTDRKNSDYMSYKPYENVKFFLIRATAKNALERIDLTPSISFNSRESSKFSAYKEIIIK